MEILGSYVHQIVAPHSILPLETTSFRIFMAGGITGCSEWQQKLWVNVSGDYRLTSDAEMSIKYPMVTMYNPRRSNFDVNDATMFEDQIVWENVKLDASDLVVFWFTKDTIQPITLLELGKELGKGSHIIIGRDDDYERADDIELQAKLCGYKDYFYNTLEDLSTAVVDVIVNGIKRR